MTAAVAIVPTSADERLPFALRLGTESDHPFVMDSWLLCERGARGREEGRRFIGWQKAMQRAILARPTTEVRVATPENDPQAIVAWAVVGRFRVPVVYYAYTRDYLRQVGLARLLLADLSQSREVVYAARPPRTWNAEERHWDAHPAVAKLPAGWSYLQRANWLEP